MNNRGKDFNSLHQKFIQLSKDVKEIDVEEETIEEYEDTLKALSQGLDILEDCVNQYVQLAVSTYGSFNSQDHPATLDVYEDNIITLDNKVSELYLKVRDSMWKEIEGKKVKKEKPAAEEKITPPNSLTSSFSAFFSSSKSSSSSISEWGYIFDSDSDSISSFSSTEDSSEDEEKRDRLLL